MARRNNISAAVAKVQNKRNGGPAFGPKPSLGAKGPKLMARPGRRPTEGPHSTGPLGTKNHPNFGGQQNQPAYTGRTAQERRQQRRKERETGYAA